jgi:hypothetical protein
MNKTQCAAKEAIEMVADELGGVDRLVAWVRESPQNERIFWGTVYPKLIAASGTADDPLHMKAELSGLNAVYGKLQPPA